MSRVEVLVILPGVFLIYRSVILSQVFLAGVLAAAGLVALWQDVGWRGRFGERQWGQATIHGGIVRVGHARRIEESYPQRGWRVPLWYLGEVSIFTGTQRPGWRYVVLRVPVWAVVGALLVHPAVSLIRGPLLRRHRRKRNLCLQCGYDRSRNPGETCSECGHRTQV